MSPQAAEALSRNPLVDYVEEDAVVELAGTQQSAPWGLDRIDQRDAPTNSTYSYAHGGAGVHAYLIDSGIRTTHKEFVTRASAGRAAGAGAGWQGLPESRLHEGGR